jgi:8-oxo-dGTP pyrophosphatase MutT (NUDIX family)
VTQHTGPSGALTLDDIRLGLGRYTPNRIELEGKSQAAVAVIIRSDESGPQVLFIERARHPDDPWSGHMAFPGGRMEPEDRLERHAAERETEEEVGVSLADASYLGRLDDSEGQRGGRPSGLVVSAHVYHVIDPPPVVPNPEVEEAFWFPVAGLLEPANHVDYRIEAMRGLTFPGILVGVPERHVVWGLTYRFLEGFFRVIGRPLPDRAHPQLPR